MSKVSLGAQWAQATADEINEYYNATTNGKEGASSGSASEPPQKRAKREMLTGNIHSPQGQKAANTAPEVFSL